ncbi:hypothetical protein GCM10027436_48090 [Actinophytocola sediminis]
MARPRRTTTSAPARNDNAPATTAAAISPCECPTTASGASPTERHTAASETITAHDAGCTTSSRANAAASPSTSNKSHETNPENASAHSRIRAANTVDSANKSRAMPTHCAPCPGKTNTTLPLRSATPVSDRDDRPSSSSPRSRPTTTARCANEVRPASENATSATSSGESRNRSRSWSARARNAPAVWPDNTSGTTAGGPSCESWSGSSGWASSSACSRMTCALVPLTPNADTAPRRGRPTTGHSRDSANNDTAPDDQSTCDDGSSTCRVRGITPCRNAITVLITPPTPAAACA